MAWFVENPASRDSGVARWDAMAHRCLMWQMPSMVALADGHGAKEVTFAQCQFDSPYQKYTTLLACEAAVPLARRALAHAVCTCKSHAKVAKGRDEFGDSLSAPAAEYPARLCEAFAQLLVDAALLYRAQREPEVVPAGCRWARRIRMICGSTMIGYLAIGATPPSRCVRMLRLR